MNTTPTESDIRMVFLAIVLALFGYLVALIFEPFLSFLLAAVLLAFVLYPLQQRLAPRLGEHIAAVVLVFGAIIGIIIPVAALVLSLPMDAERLSTAVGQAAFWEQLNARLQQQIGADLPLRSVISDAPEQLAQVFVGDLSTVIGTATHAFLGLVLFLFVLYYLLTDGELLVEWIHEMTPLGEDVQKEIFDEAHLTTWAVLKGHVFVAIIQAIVAGAGLFIVGIPHVLFWTVVMMITELLPIVGVAAVVGPALIYLFAVGDVLQAAFLLVYSLTAVSLIDDYLRALVVDHESSLHSSVILVSVLGGVYVFGVMGVFYGPIILGLFKTLTRLFNEKYLPEG